MILVLIQFSSIGWLAFSCQYHDIGFLSFLLMIASFFLVTWSVLTMQKSKLKIFPEPSPDAILVKEGPYKYIRHPMYTSVLLGCIGLILIDFNLIRLIVFSILFFDLLFKLEWEEKMLLQKFAGYQDYCKSTHKLIPLIF